MWNWIRALDQAWNKLLNYESRSILIRKYEQKHGSHSQSKSAAAEISATITQARRYFFSASDADIVIKPLLLYYGVLGLTRALILFNGHKRREANLDQKHGITTYQWAQTLTATPGGVSSLEIKLDRSGTFNELINAVSNRTLLRINSSAVQGETRQLYSDDADYRISFLDILERTPALKDFVTTWLNKPLDMIMLHSIVESGAGKPTFTWKLSCGDNAEHNLQNILQGQNYEILSKDEGDLYNVRFPSNANLYLWSEINSFWATGSCYFIKPFANLRICQIGALFAASYIIGMLARYHPSHWTALARNERDDAAFPTIQSLVNHIETRFPAMILDMLEWKPTER